MSLRCFLVAMLWLSAAVANAQTSGQRDAPAADTPSPTVKDQSFEIYCDFRCPFCAKFFVKLLAGAEAEDRTVIFRFKHYPFHEGSDTLARFYESAMLNYPEKKELLIQSLYKFREQTEYENLERIIPALSIAHGMDVDLIRRDMKARDSAFAISESKRSAVAKGVSGTPTVFHGPAQLPAGEPEQIARYILENSPRKPGHTSSPTASDSDCSSCKPSGSMK